MTERVVIISAPNIVANKVNYTDQVVNTATPEIVTNVTVSGVTTDVTTDTLNFVFTGIGEESLPNPTLFKRGQEFTSLVDRLSASVAKTFVETQIIGDTFNVLIAYNRAFTESKTTSELFIKTLGKGVQDTAQKSDVSFYRVGKSIADTETATDSKAIRANKFLVDTAQRSDISFYRVGKTAADYVLFTTDQLARTVNYNRQLSDFIDATDDFLGEANIDDDQIARVNKVLIEYANTGDNIRSVRIGKAVVDIATTNDQLARTVNYNRQFVDTAQKLDSNFYRFNKLVADTSTATDIFTRAISYNRILTDQAQKSDTSFYRIGKGVLDTAQESDVSFYQVGKPVVDIATTTDQLARTVNYNRQLTNVAQQSDINFYRVNKGLVDTETAIDLFTRIVDYNRQLTDLAQQSDISFYQVGKNLADTTTSTDLFSRVVTYNRQLSDFIDATDDFLGEANIDDDQIARVNKVVIDYGTAADEFNRIVDYNRQLTDLAQQSDISFYQVGKSLADTTTSTDLFSRVVTYNQQLSDLADAYDNFLDEPNIDDYPISRIGKVLVDYGTTADDVRSMFFGKNLEHIGTSSDLFSSAVNYNRQLTDFTTATDDFLGLANIDDDQTARVDKTLLEYANTTDTSLNSFGKLLQDNYTGTDTPYKTPSKNILETLILSDVITFLKFTGYELLDTVASNDSGFINNQNYFADTYVLPGYVGTNTNFS